MNLQTDLQKNNVLSEIKKLSKAKKTVSKDRLLSFCSEAVSVLKNEVTDYRSAIAGTDDIPGGLLDFTGRNDCDVIVVPDLHARKELIYRLLSCSAFEETPQTVFDLLCGQKLKIIFLGDILHSEGLCKERWQKAFLEYDSGNAVSDAMNEEMADGLSVLMQVMLLKSSFPESVHCLKGNHENIKNENANGNHSFYKFVLEGSMVFDFMFEKYGIETIEKISEFEYLLPLACFFDNFIVSHAEPLECYSREKIINSALYPDVIEGLTWTRNGQVKIMSALEMINENCAKNDMEKKYITGHRPVREKYALRQDGVLVQIHNPYRMQFAFIKNKTAFNPEKDIIELI
ncbi:MAG: hypothetical protein ACI4LX_11970 [Treponema sp.]